MLILQKHLRGWLARCWYKRCLKAIVYLQCCIRRMRARRELKKLKIEARSVEHFKKLNKGMENKIMQLQRRIDDQVALQCLLGDFLFLFLGCFPDMWSTSRLQNKENRSLNDKLFSLENSYTAESERMRGELSRLRRVEEEARSKSNQVSSLQEELEKLRKELSTTQQEKKTIEEWAQTYRDEMEKVSQEPPEPGKTGVPHMSLCGALMVLLLGDLAINREIHIFNQKLQFLSANSESRFLFL